MKGKLWIETHNTTLSYLAHSGRDWVNINLFGNIDWDSSFMHFVSIIHEIWLPSEKKHIADTTQRNDAQMRLWYDAIIFKCLNYCLSLSTVILLHKIYEDINSTFSSSEFTFFIKYFMNLISLLTKKLTH